MVVRDVLDLELQDEKALPLVPDAEPEGAAGMTEPMVKSASARPQLDNTFVLAHKRERIAEAIAELGVARGIRATRIADIVKLAGVARKTFYDIFPEGKQEATAYCVGHTCNEVLSRLECEGLGGAIAWCLRNALLVNLVLVEGRRIHLERVEDFHLEAAQWIAPAGEEAGNRELLAVGSIFELLARQLQRGASLRSAIDQARTVYPTLYAPRRRAHA
jgi:AcrR family transcriptional regulator